MKFFKKTEGQSDFHGNGREYQLQGFIGTEGLDPSKILTVSFHKALGNVTLVELRKNCDQTFSATMTAKEFFELLDELKQLAMQETGQIPDGSFWRVEDACSPRSFQRETIEYVRKDGHWWRMDMAHKDESDMLPGPSGETPLEKHERINAMKKAAMLGVM